jgi:hypothetical protein
MSDYPTDPIRSKQAKEETIGQGSLCDGYDSKKDEAAN